MSANAVSIPSPLLDTTVQTIHEMHGALVNLQTLLRTISADSVCLDDLTEGLCHVGTALAEKWIGKASLVSCDLEGAIKAAATQTPEGQPAPAQQAGDCAKHAMESMQRFEELAGLFYAIEAAQIQNNRATVLVLASLGKRTADDLVFKCGDVHLAAICAARAGVGSKS